MSRSDWEEIRDNVLRSFQDCKKDGRDFLDVMTALLWLERHKNESLCAALEGICTVAGAALDERPASSGPTNLLQMVINPETGLPSRNQVEWTLTWNGQSDSSHEVSTIEVAEKDCTSDQRQCVSPAKEKNKRSDP